MNRTATKSFHELFRASGYKSFHYSCADVVTGEPIILATEMLNNLQSYKHVLHRMTNASAYSDMFWHREDVWIDGVKMYRELYNQFPDAYFILQTRDMYHWLLSKKNHKDGDYIRRCMQYHNLSMDEMLTWFENDRNEHEANVRKFFENKTNLLEFNIDIDDISKFIDFLKPDYFLNEKHWGHYV